MGRKAVFPQQDLAERLRQALEDADISQADLGRACGVTDQAVYDWLRTGRIGKQHLVTICVLTKKPLEYFLVGLKTWRRAAAIALPFLIAPLLSSPTSAQAAIYHNNFYHSADILHIVRRLLAAIASGVRFLTKPAGILDAAALA